MIMLMGAMRSMAVLLVLVLALPALADKVETELADPEPGFDEPRRIMLQISTSDERIINNTLYNVANIQKFYGMDNVEILVVVFGDGMVTLYNHSPVRDRITSLMKYGITFLGCGNTMDAQHRNPDDLIDGVDFVQAGIPEIVERQLQGWAYVRP